MNQALRDRILDELDCWNAAVTEGDAASTLPLARSELGRLAEGLRALLTEHLPDEDGRCRVCPGTRRGRRWPCKVWTIARTNLLGSPTPHVKRQGSAASADDAVPGKVPAAEPEGDETDTEEFEWFV
jgi:hypothetical protein